MVAEINLHDEEIQQKVNSTIYYYGGKSHNYWTLWSPRAKMIFFGMKDRIIYVK